MAETALLQSFAVNAKSSSIPYQNLYHCESLIEKHIQMPIKGILLKMLFNTSSKTIVRFPHINSYLAKKYPNSWWKAQHGVI